MCLQKHISYIKPEPKSRDRGPVLAARFLFKKIPVRVGTDVVPQILSTIRSITVNES